MSVKTIFTIKTPIIMTKVFDLCSKSFLLGLLLSFTIQSTQSQDYEQVIIPMNTEFVHTFKCYPWPPQPTGANNGTVTLNFMGIENGFWNNDLGYTPNPGFLGLDSIQQCYTDTLNQPVCKYFEIEVVMSTSLAENDLPKNGIAISLFPNPFVSHTQLQIQVDHPDTYDIALYDATGRLLRKVYHGKLLLGEHRFLIAGLEGLFFCKVEDSEGEVVWVKGCGGR
jgi:hypothetical protein